MSKLGSRPLGARVVEDKEGTERNWSGTQLPSRGKLVGEVNIVFR